MSYALRHPPWEYDLELDSEGFVKIDQFLDSLNSSKEYGRNITIEDLKRVIKTSDKKRHKIVDDKIRALYGHSIPNKITKEKALPPDVLYHGTAHRLIDSILQKGLLPMNRQYVHLSKDIETAMLVGKRRDANPVILEIDSKSASNDGIVFYIGNEKCFYVIFFHRNT